MIGDRRLVGRRVRRPAAALWRRRVWAAAMEDTAASSARTTMGQELIDPDHPRNHRCHHAVIDGLFSTEALRAVAAELPQRSAAGWTTWDTANECKHVFDRPELFGRKRPPPGRRPQQRRVRALPRTADGHRCPGARPPPDGGGLLRRAQGRVPQRARGLRLQPEVVPGAPGQRARVPQRGVAAAATGSPGAEGRRPADPQEALGRRSRSVQRGDQPGKSHPRCGAAGRGASVQEEPTWASAEVCS